MKESAAYYGPTFVQFKERVDQGEHPVKVANEILKPIGKGSHRIVYEFPDNKDHILKVVNVELDPFSEDPKGEEFYAADWKNPKTGFDRSAKVLANEWEANVALQQKYPDVVPKSYEKDPDYSWILVEKVTPIDNKTMFDKFNLLTDRYDYLLMNMDSKNRSIRDKAYSDLQGLLQIPINYMKGIQDPTKKRWTHSALKEVAEPTTATVDWAKNFEDSSTIDVEKTSAEKPASPQLSSWQKQEIELLRSIFSDTHNRKLFLAIAELDIPVREILGKNLGINSLGNLVLLDISLWDKVKKSTEL